MTREEVIEYVKSKYDVEQSIYGKNFLTISSFVTLKQGNGFDLLETLIIIKFK